MAVYKEDILKDKFERQTIQLGEDREGLLIATLIRRLSNNRSEKAILYIHGFNDYFFQKELAYNFNDQGYNFYAIDLRKYGRSWLPGQTFNDIGNLKDYYHEIVESLSIIKNEGNSNTVLMGHSTGGLIVSLFARDYWGSSLFNRVILNSPFFDFNLTPFTKSIILPTAVFLSKVFPKFAIKAGFSDEYGKSLHKNYFGEWDYELKWKPITSHPVTLKWVNAIYKGQKSFKKNFSIAQPLLVMHSAHSTKESIDQTMINQADAILDVKDINKIANKIKGKVEIVSINGGLHDLILSQKPVREKVYNTIFDWLNKNQQKV